VWIYGGWPPLLLLPESRVGESQATPHTCRPLISGATQDVVICQIEAGGGLFIRALLLVCRLASGPCSIYPSRALLMLESAGDLARWEEWEANTRAMTDDIEFAICGISP
jgi:hypothetical protein